MATTATVPVFSPGTFPCAHASTVVELANGDLLAAWFAGTSEGEKDCAIWSARRDGGVWSRPTKLVREPQIACYNPVLFHTSDRRLWLYYKFGAHPMSWTAGRTVSLDDGLTWGPVEHLPAGLYGPIRAKPLVLPDGTIVSGTSVETYRSWACWIERSTDHGGSWLKAGPITVPRELTGPGVSGEAPPAVPGSNEWKATEGIIQPSVIALAGGRLRLYARSTARIGRVCVADSIDAGRSWTPARPIDVPNPNSGIDAVALADGRVLLVYNHSDDRRWPLNVALSMDGEVFAPCLTLESEPGEYSYPAVIQGRTGDVHVTYTVNRTTIRHATIPLSLLPAR